jgi:phosphoribosylanthranilate isomerase
MRIARTRVKVCGLCEPCDAHHAVLAGADALGVILAESPRQVTVAEAEEIFGVAPPMVSRIGVFVDAPADFVASAAARLRLSAVQLHGDEDPSYCGALPVPVIKAFRVAPEFDPQIIEAYRGVIAGALLDTFVPGQPGGTGKAFAWHALDPMPAWTTLIVAGGLRPVNVGVAIRALRPFAVDVSTGVEERLRHKDPAKLTAFVAAVRAADEEVGTRAY